MSELSNVGKTWSTKLQRIGELAARDEGVVFNNLGHLISVDLLRDLYRQLDGSKAIGIDGVTKADYGTNLEEKLSDLIKRIRRGQYQPKPARLVEIPKEDGSTRPLAISCFEDKLVQLAASTILGKVFEPLFLKSSYGFRPNLNCHDALKALSQSVFKMKDGAVVEIDIRKYFNTIPHGPLFEFLENKISDGRFLKLLEALVLAPTVQDGQIIGNERGCPQGSILSPILANIYLHYVIDEWFAAISKSHLKGDGVEIRYADDVVFVFEYASQAERFYKVLGKRLSKYGLEMHEEKSRLIPSGSRAAARAYAAGKRIPVYNFVGFTCYWALSRNGKLWRLKVKSRSDRKNAKLVSLRKFLKENRNTSNTPQLMSRVKAVVRGWVNYHAVSDNERQVRSFIYESKMILYKWFNSRGGRKKWNWDRLSRLLKRINYPTTFKLVSLYPTPNRAKA